MAQASGHPPGPKGLGVEEGAEPFGESGEGLEDQRDGEEAGGNRGGEGSRGSPASSDGCSPRGGARWVEAGAEGQGRAGCAPRACLPGVERMGWSSKRRPRGRSWPPESAPGQGGGGQATTPLLPGPAAAQGAPSPSPGPVPLGASQENGSTKLRAARALFSKGSLAGACTFLFALAKPKVIQFALITTISPELSPDSDRRSL